MFFGKMLSVPCEDCAMRLNLREIIHVPGASIPFEFSLDLTQEDFFGEYPITRPVQVSGSVKHRRRSGAGGGGQVPSGPDL